MIKIINRYLTYCFLSAFGLLFLGIYALIVLFDTIELNRAIDDATVHIGQLISVSAMRAPSLMLKALPFIVLLAVMIAYARLARSSEITVMRASGMSSSGLVLPVVVTSIGLGIISFTLFHPLSAWLMDHVQRYEADLTGNASAMNTISISGEGLWLRQGTQGSYTIIHADHASTDATGLEGVTFYRYDQDDQLLARLDAQSATLEPAFNIWRLKDVRELVFSETTSSVREHDLLEVPTNLTPEKILDSFSSKNTVSFWDLPRFIQTLNESGLSAGKHILHLQSLLSLPLTYVSMVLMAAAFSMRPRRFGGLGVMALASVVCGFVYYFIQDVSLALGGSGALPPIIAAWAPPISAFSLGVGLLLHMEDT